VIIGGQSLSLVLALLVTPIFYALLDQWVNFTRRIGIRFSVQRRPHPVGGNGVTPHSNKHEPSRSL
jgi:hydrophobic/amphiphilic exporter-1 (mainly G- bacteria), HAE1 family